MGDTVRNYIFVGERFDWNCSKNTKFKMKHAYLVHMKHSLSCYFLFPKRATYNIICVVAYNNQVPNIIIATCFIKDNRRRIYTWAQRTPYTCWVVESNTHKSYRLYTSTLRCLKDGVINLIYIRFFTHMHRWKSSSSWSLLIQYRIINRCFIRHDLQPIDNCNYFAYRHLRH